MYPPSVCDVLGVAFHVAVHLPPCGVCRVIQCPPFEIKPSSMIAAMRMAHNTVLSIVEELKTEGFGTIGKLFSHSS